MPACSTSQQLVLEHEAKEAQPGGLRSLEEPRVLIRYQAGELSEAEPGLHNVAGLELLSHQGYRLDGSPRGGAAQDPGADGRVCAGRWHGLHRAGHHQGTGGGLRAS